MLNLTHNERMQIKTIMRYHFPPLLDWLKFEKVKVHSFSKEDRHFTLIASRNLNGQPQSLVKVIKDTIADSFNPAIPFLGIYPVSISSYL